MNTRTRIGRLAAGVALVAVLGAACGSDDSDRTAAQGATEEAMDHSPAAPSTEQTAAAGTDTAAAGLRAGLTSLLQEHVYLAGIATGTALGGGDLSAPAAVLDENSVALSEAVGSVYGDAAGKQFLDLWRKHIGFFVDYTVGGITGDQQAQKKAKQALDRYRQDFGAFIDSATNGELPKDAVAGALQEHVNSLIKTIDAVIAGKGNPFMSLYEASHMHMPGTASALAGGIIAANPDKF